jgi:hypothetical protein
MLYLHCGWPKTSTTSLQAVLYDHKDALRAGGLAYPDEWRSAIGPTHHGLDEILGQSRASERAFDDFRRLLDTHAAAGKDVLASAEVLSSWVVSAERLEAFLGLIVAAQEAMPVRCLWTLRRHDELLVSLLMQSLKMGLRTPPALQGGLSSILERDDAARLTRKFAGMLAVEQAVGGNVVYVEYDPEGGHNLALLNELGIGPGLVAELGEALESGPRRRLGPTLKEAVVLLNVDAMSARAGVDLDRRALQGLLTGRDYSPGEFEFEDDRRCSPAGVSLRRDLHERALVAAREAGLTAYVEFFRNARVETPPPTALDPEIVTDDDLGRLVSRLRQMEPAQAQAR